MVSEFISVEIATWSIKRHTIIRVFVFLAQHSLCLIFIQSNFPRTYHAFAQIVHLWFDLSSNINLNVRVACACEADHISAGKYVYFSGSEGSGSSKVEEVLATSSLDFVFAVGVEELVHAFPLSNKKILTCSST